MPNSVQGLPSMSRWSLLIFRVTCSEVKVKPLFSVHCLVRSISIWSIPNLVQGLPLMSKWSLLIFSSHVQGSRSNASSQPTVLSAQCLLTPSLDQYQTCCRGCPQWVDDPYWFSGHRFKGQGQTTLSSPVCSHLNIFWPLHSISTKLGAGVAPNKVKVKPLLSTVFKVI